MPRTFPAPAVAYPVGSQGTLVVAHPELFVEQVPAHRDAVEQVRATLQAAGVLVPAYQVT